MQQPNVQTAAGESFYHSLIAQHARDGVIVTDDRGLFLWGNKSFENISGRSIEEMVGRKPGEFLQGPGTNPETVDALRSALREKRPIRVEILNYHKSGKEYWLELDIAPVFDKDGRHTHFVAIERDVHTRVELARENNALLRAIDASDDLVLMVSQDGGRIIYSNSAVETTAGAAVDRDLTLSDVFANADTLDIAGATESGATDAQARLSAANGDIFEISLQSTRLANEDDCTLVIARNISEKVLLEKQKRRFISTVSHELRAPVTSIKGSLGILAMGALESKPEEATRLAKVALSSCDRLEQLINDIVDSENLNSGEFRLDIQTVSIDEVLTQTHNEMKGYLSRYNVQLQIIGDDPDLRVLGDKRRLVQVFVNLVSNAIKYSHAGGCVQLAVSSQRGSCKVDVIDAGVGIGKEDLARIFEPFIQAKPVDGKSRPGSGLGLSIVKELVERQNGRVCAQSTVGKGTTISVELPLDGARHS